MLVVTVGLLGGSWAIAFGQVSAKSKIWLGGEVGKKAELGSRWGRSTVFLSTKPFPLLGLMTTFSKVKNKQGWLPVSSNKMFHWEFGKSSFPGFGNARDWIAFKANSSRAERVSPRGLGCI